jgi:hypothetical protein
VLKVFFFTSVRNTFNTVSYKEQFLIKLASTKNVTFNVSCIKIVVYLTSLCVNWAFFGTIGPF